MRRHLHLAVKNLKWIMAGTSPNLMHRPLKGRVGYLSSGTQHLGKIGRCENTGTHVAEFLWLFVVGHRESTVEYGYLHH